MIHNSYNLSFQDLINIINTGANSFEIDVVNGFFNVYVGHARNPFRIGYKGKLRDWLNRFQLLAEAKKLPIEIGIEFKSYSYELADRVAQIIKCLDLSFLEFVILKPAENWFYGNKRQKIADYFLNRYGNDLKLKKGY